MTLEWLVLVQGVSILLLGIGAIIHILGGHHR